MPQPTLSEVGQELYDRLVPLAYDDEANGWALAYFCDAVGKQFDEIAGWVRDSPDGDPGWSALLDLDRAPSKGLGWLAQFIGASLIGGLTDEQQRAWIASGAGANRGTTESIRQAILPTITGTQRIVVYERRDPGTFPADEPYHLTIRTLNSETADPSATEAAIVSQKPAGIVLHYAATDGQDFATLESGHADYAAVFSDYTDYNELLIG